MTDERELKLPLEDKAVLRERLQREGALQLHAEGFEDNVVWDREGALRDAGCLLRVRVDGRGARLTYKGPKRFEDGVKVRLEHETAAADGKSLVAILQALGYAPVRRYQKRREEWILERVVIALDETPIGSFVEFEGDAAKAVAKRCGLDPATAIEADYLTLYDAWRRSHPGAPEEMLFPPTRGEDG